MWFVCYVLYNPFTSYIFSLKEHTVVSFNEQDMGAFLRLFQYHKQFS